MPHDYEKLGVFYLGREVDPGSGQVTDQPILYDSRDLTTHGVIIGMTGSGKTGLAISVLEEAAMDGIPVLAIDPKGDLANLMLTFPDLSEASFRPWVNEEAAARKGLSADAFAAAEARSWKDGLAQWDQDGERIARLRANADFRVYTPGSTSGLPLSVLESFDAPPAALLADADGLRDRVQSTVAGLLGLLGIEADPIRSREHILLASILDHAWREGRGLDLGGLIQAIQQPPFTRLGVMELESVYPSKERFELAMQMNALLASPSFQAWMEGTPLDIPSLLYTPEGKPRVAIFSIAHLGDQERMFFVTLFLSAVLAWMRGQSGTTGLRALVYMDEVFGFFPPVANPPSKPPMLTLLKQARAFGVGLVLATQNPVDLDYKGLGNAGTWFIGRLQTERDKARVLEALDGAMAGSTPMPREELDRLISGLGKRVFLMHDVHRGAPELIATRWAMSYLAGPMTLAQIREVTKGAAAVGGAAAVAGSTGQGMAERAGEAPTRGSPSGSGEGMAERAGGEASSRPILPPEIRQVFVDSGSGQRYRPGFLALADVRYSSKKYGIEETRAVHVLTDLDDGLGAPPADRTRVLDIDASLLAQEPLEGSTFGSLPADASKPKSYDKWGKETVRWIQGALPITLFESPAHKAFSAVGESKQDFLIRVASHAREALDARKDKLRKKYEPKLRALEEKLRRAEQAVEREAAQSKQAMLDTGISAIGAMLGGGSRRSGGGLLGAFLGGRTTRVATAARSATRAARQRQDVAQAEETVDAVQAQIADLETEFRQELSQIEAPSTAGEQVSEVVIRPALNAISVRWVALAWVPE